MSMQASCNGATGASVKDLESKKKAGNVSMSQEDDQLPMIFLFLVTIAIAIIAIAYCAYTLFDDTNNSSYWRQECREDSAQDGHWARTMTYGQHRPQILPYFCFV